MSSEKGFTKYGLTIGEVYESNRCGSFEIIEFIDVYTVVVKFHKTNTVSRVRAASIRKGSVGDRNHPAVFGVGYVGYGQYKTRFSKTSPKTPHYSAWENMMARCYYPKTSRYSAYGGIGVKVCDEWHNFQVFAKWFDNTYIEGNHLDKDLVGDGKLYSPENCEWVPQEINCLLVNRCKNIGRKQDLPEGLTLGGNKYYTGCSTYGEHGRFSSIKNAMDYYKKIKTKAVRTAVLKAFDEGRLSEKAFEVLSEYTYKYSDEDMKYYYR